jgi:hypothetical protein
MPPAIVSKRTESRSRKNEPSDCRRLSRTGVVRQRRYTNLRQPAQNRALAVLK